MATIHGTAIIDNVPHINGKPAVQMPPLADGEVDHMEGVLSRWKCPECGARLGAVGYICLNACHLSAASYQRFVGFMKRVNGGQEGGTVR